MGRKGVPWGASKDERPRCSRAVVLRGLLYGAMAPQSKHLRMTEMERDARDDRGA
jgi:hypothetical protein